MNPEPLKDKIREFHPAKSEVNVINGFSKQEVMSAVEWLKKELRSLPPEMSRKQLDIQLAHIIPIAFHDACTFRSKNAVRNEDEG